MTSKPEDICSKFHFKKITKYEGVVNYKIIREIHRKSQANMSTIFSELGGGHHGLLGLVIQPSTYHTVIGKYFQRPVRTPQEAPVPTNADAAEIPSYIQVQVPGNPGGIRRRAPGQGTTTKLLEPPHHGGAVGHWRTVC